MQDWDDAYVSVRFLGEVMLFWGKLERLDF